MPLARYGAFTICVKSAPCVPACLGSVEQIQQGDTQLIVMRLAQHMCTLWHALRNQVCKGYIMHAVHDLK